MSDSLRSYYDDCDEYKELCKYYNVKEQSVINTFGVPVINYNHFNELENKYSKEKNENIS